MWHPKFKSYVIGLIFWNADEKKHVIKWSSLKKFCAAEKQRNMTPIFKGGVVHRNSTNIFWLCDVLAVGKTFQKEKQKICDRHQSC